MFNRNFCEKQLRELGMTKTALAERCGVTPQHISNVLVGNRNPSVKLVSNMAKALGVRSGDLWQIDDKLYIEEPKKAYKGVESVSLGGVWITEDEAKSLYDWFEAGGLIDAIRSYRIDCDNMEWLSTMMCIYAKCKGVV